MNIYTLPIIGKWFIRKELLAGERTAEKLVQRGYSVETVLKYAYDNAGEGIEYVGIGLACVRMLEDK